MEVEPIQILEVRAGEPPRPVTITTAVSADASQAILVALSEQLDRQRHVPIETADDVLALRDQAALVERFAPLAAAEAHTVVQFTDTELQACLVDLTAYRGRVDTEHFQSPDQRGRLETIAAVIPVLWEANASAALAGGEPPDASVAVQARDGRHRVSGI